MVPVWGIGADLDQPRRGKSRKRLRAPPDNLSGVMECKPTQSGFASLIRTARELSEYLSAWYKISNRNP